MTENEDRARAIALRLNRFELAESDPRWSSYALDRFFDEVMSDENYSIRDVYQGLDAALRSDSVRLTSTVAAFIKDVVVRCFTRYRGSYNSVDWKRVADNLSDKATAAQLYLALHAIPPQFVTPQLSDAIAKGLQTTAFQDEAASALLV